jgi:1,4-dihydroxy-2-naphthoate octaprenyltransferase
MSVLDVALGVRPKLFGLALAPVLLVSLRYEAVLSLRTALCACTAILLQGGLHLVNTFFDYQAKVDTKGYQYSDKLIVEKNASPSLVVGLGALLVLGGAAVGIAAVGSPMSNAAICVYLAVVLGVLYSKPLKHWYCGDLIVIIVFGPLLAQFTAYCHDAEDYDLSLMPIILPHTLLVEAWLMGRNARDCTHDDKVQSGSLAASMGEEPSMLMYAALIVLVNLSIVNLIFIESYWYAVVLLSLFLAWPAMKLSLKADYLSTVEPMSLKLHILVNALVGLGLLLSQIFKEVEKPDADSIF